MTRLRIFVAWAVVATTILVVQVPSFGSPTGIDGCFFRDLNGSSIQGDAANPGAFDEIAFTEPITLQLVDLSSGSPTVTVTTDPVTGCFDFPGLADGVDYQINVAYPPEYYSSPTGGDTDFVPGAPPSIAGDPFTSSYNFTYNTGDDLSISGGVSGLPELSLGYFITPTGDQMIETGTATFNTTGNCPTQTPGDDCGEFDDVVRTNDVTTIGYTITADNIPDPGTNPLNDVVLEQTITPNPGAVVEVPNLHPSCLTTGVSPVSSIAVDPGTGVITVTCNLGPKGNGTSIVPTFIRTDGASEDGSSFEVSARLYSGTDRAQLNDSSVLEPEEIFISAAPRFDVTKGNDASNPFNRVVFLQFTERVNPVTGVLEYGANYSWDISVIYDGGTKGQAALADPITFSDAISADFPGWLLVSCTNRPWGNGGLPIDNAGPEDWGDRGTWNCAEDRANNEIDITVTGADTDGDPVPTAGDNGTNLASGPFIAFAGRVQIWYPVSDFYRTVDPNWEYGDDPITGDYSLDNLITNFDPLDETGQENFAGAGEPTENNDRTVNVRISETGGFSKHLGSYEWADDRIPDGSLTGTASTWPCGSGTIANGSLLSGQTQACSSGDAPVQPGEKAQFWFWLRNNGTFPWAADTFELCDAFDNSTMTLTSWTGGEHVYIRNGPLPANGFIVEYATAGFNDNVGANDWTGQLAAVSNCTAPNNDWSTDPLSFDPDPQTSLEQVGMIRVRLDPTIVDEVGPSEWAQISFPVDIRDTYNGGPNDGQPIPVGTILANNANRAFGDTPYSATAFGAEDYVNSAWGDRMLLNRYQVRISKTTSIDPTSPTDDDLNNVQGTDQVVWWLQPAVTAVTPATASNVQVIDTLPAGITYDPFCQASQPVPAGVTLTSVTNNPDGTTTLLYDLGDRPTNVAIDPIPICTKVDSFLEPGTDLTNNVEITADGDVSPEGTRSDERTVSVIAAGEFQLVKEVDAPLELQLDSQTYTIGWTNLSASFDFAPPDVIDVWPYNGDSVNPLNIRTEFDSNYSGSYELTNWMPQPTTFLSDGSTAVTNGVWYYSADDPNTIPYDADHPDNNLAAAGGVNWCTQPELTTGVAPCDFTFSDSTAVRFVQEDILESSSSVSVEYTFQAGTPLDPNAPADRYVNRFAARTDSVSDLIRSNEVLVQVLSMSLGDLVFLDADVDGAFTNGVDVPVAGTVVELWVDDGTGTFVFLDSTTTDANGRYIFEELLQGTYEVRIPDAELNGGTLDTLTQTVNPLPADNDDNENVDQQASDSGLGYTTSGPVTLSADTTVDPPIGQEPTGENVNGIGNPDTFDNLTNLTVDLGFRGDPAIEIIKEVCDSALGSCDLTTDPLDPADGWVETAVVPFTSTAQWRITVRNTGFEVLTNIVVDDPAEAGCNQASGAIADLGIGESFSYICSTTNVVEDVLNTAAVEAEGSGSGISVDDDDSAAVETPPADPDIEVVKYVNGDDAQTAPGIYINPGDPVTFTYEVSTGTGTVPLEDISVSDDNGTPLDATDDFTATYVSGDTDTDGILDLGETWVFEATGFAAITGQYANWATAAGTPVTPGAAELTDLDPAHYFGVDGGLEITKLVNDDDANSAPGVLVNEGDPVTFTYTVENIGNTELDITSFTDDAGTSGVPGDDWTPTFVGGDTDSDGLLDINEEWTYEYVGQTAVADQYTNLASITADDPLGNEFAASDPANYYGVAPAFTLEKATNTIDADVDPVLVAEDGAVVWEYVLTNTGNADISNPRVSDDNGTPGDLTDDFFAAYVSGDDDNDGVLDVGEVWIFRAIGIATETSYTNNATATGIGPSTVDEDGNTVPGESLEDDDPSSYIVASPEIAITKSTNGVNNTSAPGVFVAQGEDVTWTYEVTNPGDVPLSNVGVVDDNGTPGDLTDDLTASLLSGDTDGDDILDLDETWIFEATGTATEGQYTNNAVVSGTPPETTNPDGTTTTPDPVTDEDDDFYFGSEPETAIIKLTNGTDNPTGTGPFIAVGDSVTWTYEVSNPGNVPLSDVSVVDDNGTPGDLTDDLTATYVSGDTNNDGILDLDETWIFEATGTATEGQYENNAVASGTPPTETDPDGTEVVPDPVTDEDDDRYFGSEPEIAVTKSTNAVDSTVAPGVFIAPGDDVTWTYEVTNPGNVPLSDVGVVDDNGTPADATDDLTATYVSGDTNADGILDLDETWIFEATGTATADQYENSATVSGTPPTETDDDGTEITPDPVTDDDDDFYYGIEPGIDVLKETNGTDNPSGIGPYIAVGDSVTWTYTVTNTGNIPLSNVGVVDDNGTPADATDDITATYVSGDTNTDGILDLDETWIFEATGTATADAYVNSATVSGTPPDVTNPDGTTTTPDPVTEEDDDRYYGIEPEIGITKLTNSVDNAAAPGILLSPGDDITWTYEVSNPGNIALRDIVVTDDNGTPADATDDLTATYVSGDTDGDGSLDTNETWIFEATGTATAGQYENNADVTATPPPTTNPDGTTTPSDPVTDEDDDFYYGISPEIDIVKATNTVDSADAPGIFVAPGSPVVWTYTVTNPGDVPLSDVGVVDDNGTPADATDDITATYVSGDTNTDGILDLDETWIFEATGTAIAGQYENNAEATGTPPETTNPDGTTSTPPVVTDDDDDFYFGEGPGIGVIKATNTVDSTEAPGVLIPTGAPVTWTYTVTNTGDVPLSSVGVVDDNGTPADATDDVGATYVSGDTNTDGILDLDETWIFEATGTATADQYENSATVSGTPPDLTNPDGTTTTPDPVTDEDDDFYYGIEPGLELLKETNGIDSAGGTGPFILAGDPVTWTYTVTNTGNIPLSNVGVVDDNGTPADATDDLTATYVSGDTNSDDILDVDETWIFEATGTATQGQYENSATVSGTPPEVTNPDGTTTTPDPVTDDDDDRYFGAEPGVEVIKSVNGDDANEAPGVLVPNGDEVSWTYDVTNTGTTPLVDIVVSDDQGVVVTCPQTTLAVGESMTCTGAAEAATLGQYTNIGSVEATPAEPTDDPDVFTPIVDPETGGPVDPVDADDPANHFGTGPGIELQKQVCDLDDTSLCDVDNDDHWGETTVIADGDDVAWRIAVTNIGNLDLADVQVSDPLAPNCAQTLPLLPVGETWSYVCVETGVTEPTTNTASVEATPTPDGFPPVTSSDTAETLEPAELELTKDVDETEFQVGETATYELVLSNTGVTDAVDIEIVDTLPEGLTSINLLNYSGLSYNSNDHTITWSIAALAVGETVSVSYTAEVAAAESLVNEVAILSDHEENNLENNSDTASITATPVPEDPPPLAFTGANSITLAQWALYLMSLGLILAVWSRRRREDPLA